MPWNEAEEQLPYEHFLKNHLPQGFVFYEHYGAFPEVEVIVMNANDAALAVKEAFETNGFPEKMVSVEPNQDLYFEEVRIAFDLLLFDEERAKECLDIAAKALSPFKPSPIN